MKASSVPYTIFRATQFFDFIGRIADSNTNGDTVHLPPVLIQPQAADDVAAALAEVALGEPVNRIVELAGPEQFRLDELAQRVLTTNNDPRRMTADIHAPLLRRRARRALPYPGRQPAYRPDSLRGLAQEVRGSANQPNDREEGLMNRRSFCSTARSPNGRQGQRHRLAGGCRATVIAAANPPRALTTAERPSEISSGALLQRFMAERPEARRMLETPGASRALSVSKHQAAADLILEAAALPAAA